MQTIAEAENQRSGRAELPGVHTADQVTAKCALAEQVVAALHEQDMSQMAAATTLQIDQPKVSRLLRGQWEEFSTPRLIRFLALLGRDVEITVRPAASRGRRPIGRLRVVASGASRR
jgi:predicted XRE-type DNA-binding protein